jgi:hypothetical protein
MGKTKEHGFTFKDYCAKFGKTLEDIIKLSPVMQEAWHEEYKLYIYPPEQRSYDTKRALGLIRTPICDEYMTLEEIGCPFDPFGEPLIGND